MRTVADLIAELESFPGDAEVRLAFQPEYPFQYHLGEIIETEACSLCDESGKIECEPCKGIGDIDDRPCKACDEEGEIDCLHPNAPIIVYIGEGGQHRDEPYLPANASSALGWRN